MSKKRVHTKEKRLATVLRNDIRSALRREYPTDPRLIVIGLVLLLLGIILYALANTFVWSGWIEVLINRVDAVLLGSGIALILVTTIGRIQGN